MKKFLQVFILFLSVHFSQLVFSEKATAQSVSFQVFYDDLSPYGSWVQNPQYGYVWCPRVSGFSPYSTNGYWVMTDAGWTWVSDYSWGWAPFHYGRWYYDDGFGYVWVPGYDWGPGWVSWRRSNEYYGWAPIGPGVSIDVAYSNGYNLPYNQWNFVSCNNFGRRDIRNYYVNRSKNVTIINNTTVINTTRVDNSRRTTYNVGPDRAEVQKKVGRQINPVAIVDEKKPGQHITKSSVQLYRPVVTEDAKAARKPAPTKLARIDEVKKQPNNSNIRKDNGAAINGRNAKQPLQPGAAGQPVKQQPGKQNNQPRPNQQQPTRKPARHEQVKQPANQPVVQQPAQQPPVRKSRDAQGAQIKQQRNAQRPVPQQPQRNQAQPSLRQQAPPRQQPAVRQAQPQRQPSAPPVRQQQPDRQPTPPPIREPQPERKQAPPVREPQPERQPAQPPVQQPPPQQNINREPERQAPPPPEPPRPAPVQQQPPAGAPRDRKG